MAAPLTYQSEFTGLEMDERFAVVPELQQAVEALTVALGDTYTREQIDAVLESIAGAVNSTKGVTVTELPSASADTLGAIYYVGPDDDDEYDRYVTGYDGETYSWLPLGTTELALDDYAAKADVLLTVPSSSYAWYSGTINTSGASSDNDKRVRSDYILANKNYTIKGDASHLFSVRYYNEKRTFLSSAPSSMTDEFSLANMPSDCVYFRIVGRSEPEAVISDPNAFGAGYTITWPSKALLDNNQNLDDVLASMFVKKVQYNLTNGYVVDARVGNSNFGKTLSQNNWSVTQYIPLRGAKYVRLYRNIATTATNPSYSGVVFYDKSSNPMTDGVVRIIYGNGGTAFADWDVLEIPAGAAYMRLGISNSAAARYEYQVELYAFSPDNIAGMQENIYTKTYYGEKVELAANAYEWRQVKSVAGSSQSAAIYDKYVFFINDSMKTIVMFNMETMGTVATCSTGNPTSDTLHCNQSQFGPYKYDEDDLFPILYTAATNDAQGCCAWYGYRIIPTVESDVITAFTVSLVQTITLPVMTDENCLGNANPAFDIPNNCIWAYSRNNNTEAANYRKAKFTKFAIPALYDGDTLVSEVTLTDADILDSFDADWSMAYAQGGFINRGRLYIGQGGPQYDYTCVRVIDLYAQRRQVTFFDLKADGVDQEPEGAFIYNGKLWIHANSGLLCRLDM